MRDSQCFPMRRPYEHWTFFFGRPIGLRLPVRLAQLNLGLCAADSNSNNCKPQGIGPCLAEVLDPRSRLMALELGRHPTCVAELHVHTMTT
jgi:hypothetical protein